MNMVKSLMVQQPIKVVPIIMKVIIKVIIKRVIFNQTRGNNIKNTKIQRNYYKLLKIIKII